jgi:hypothetical protein
LASQNQEVSFFFSRFLFFFISLPQPLVQWAKLLLTRLISPLTAKGQRDEIIPNSFLIEYDFVFIASDIVFVSTPMSGSKALPVTLHTLMLRSLFFI